MSSRTQVTTMNNRPQQNKTLPQILGSWAVAFGFLLVTAVSAGATEKTEYEDVFINGYKLGFFEQLALEDHIDRDIPDGQYWFDLDTGMWGPVGGPAIGHIEVPEDYQDYVKSKLSQTRQPTEVQLSAAAEDCDTDCLYW